MRCATAALLCILLLPLAPGHGSQAAASVPGAPSPSAQQSLAAEVQAETAAWTRTLEPVIVPGSELPWISGWPTATLHVYAYDGAADTWSAVPFQIDEVNADGEYVASEDGNLDANDELVFMAADLGSQATTSQWLDDPDSQSFSRYELKVTNPLNTAEVGWVYVYSTTLASTFDPYVSVTTLSSKSHRLTASNYIATYDANEHAGMDSLELNGTGEDVLDRSKIRVAGSCLTSSGWQSFSVTENDSDMKNKYAAPSIEGPVRAGGGSVSSQSWNYASLFVADSEFDAGSANNSYCSEMVYDLFQLTDDWVDPSVSGMTTETITMKYYDSNTAAEVPVDGTPDTVSEAQAGWQQVSGARGSLVRVADITPGGATVKNYYKDDSTVDDSDTGDQVSYGDMGYKLESPTGLVRLSLAYYVLGADQGAVGGTYKDYRDNPLQVAATCHDYNLPAPPSLSPIANDDGDGAYTVAWTGVTSATNYLLEEADNSAFDSATPVYDGGIETQVSLSDRPYGRWYYRVQATTDGGTSPWSNVESAGVIPATPTLNSIDNTDYDGAYTVSWSAAAGATGYELQEDDNDGFSTPAIRYTGTYTECEVTGQKGGTWYYRVRASNAGGYSAPSNVESAGVKPAAPTLAAIANDDGDGSYLVDWDDVTGATSYRLEVDGDSNFGSSTLVYEDAASQYQVSGQATGEWFYRVRASNSYGDSPWSSSQSVKVVPAAPSLNAINNPDGLADYIVSWSAVDGATSYQLQEADNDGFTSATVRYDDDGTQFQVSGQPTGMWYYQVRASSSGGYSAWSNTQSVAVRPAAPVLAEIDNPLGDGTYLVDWSDVEGATGYRLEEDDNPDFTSIVVRHEGSASEYQVSAQETGEWYYRVLASSAGGDSPWSNTVSTNVVLPAPVLDPIDNPDGDGSYLVQWSTVAVATAYQLEEADNDGFASPTPLYDGDATQYQVSGRSTGRWYYRVRASNASGTSPWSDTESVGVVPAAPTLAPIDNPGGDGDYLIDWSDVTGASG
jgi:hypothetical protein